MLKLAMNVARALIFLGVIVVLLTIVLIAATRKKSQENLDTQTARSTLSISNSPIPQTIVSGVFENNGIIPKKYTCDGKDINPPLTLLGIPDSAKSLAIIVDDPDAPSKVWSHWLVWNISPDTTEIAENAFPKESIIGRNDSGKNHYSGPCPPPGTSHHYRFKLIVLDTKLTLTADASQKDLEEAVKGHILGQSSVVGVYAR